MRKKERRLIETKKEKKDEARPKGTQKSHRAVVCRYQKSKNTSQWF